MNQIICTSNKSLEIQNKNLKKKHLLQIQFYISIIITISIILYYIFFRYDLYKLEKLSQKLIHDFNITTLYSDNLDYAASLINEEISYSEGSTYSVIGMIEITKLNISYPILSEINKEFLKISPCRFYGPNPNEVGNLCIAAHNYKNGTFFSNLSNLTNGDIITIYDINNNSINYIIYNVYKSDANDLECINQNTNNRKIVTLVTCDTLDNNYRTIVKAKEI